MISSNFFNLLCHINNIAVIDSSGTKLTYEELYSEGSSLTANLPKRSLVFSLCSNSIGSVLGYTAFLNHRIVPLMLDEHVDKSLLYNFLNIYKPDYLWLPDSEAAVFDGTQAYSAFGYTLLKRNCEYKFPLHEELALLLTTSGSTGSPKFVRQSYTNIDSNTTSIVRYLELNDTERAITTLPMNYTYGLSIINTHLRAGATLILSPYTVLQREFWELFSKQRVTSFGGVPYTYEMLDKLRFYKRQMPFLRTMTQAGGKLQPALHKKFAEYARQEGKRFIVMYGAAEATARMGYLPADKALEKCGSMGIAIPGGKFRLLDSDGHEISTPDTVGELLYEGPNVTLGYAERGEDLAKGDERGGCLLTGDLAVRDAEGFYTIVGRKSRFLKLFGNRVGLDETERLIKSFFSDFDCACVGKDDAMYVFITDAGRVAEVRSFLADKTKLNASAFHVKFLQALPKNSAGKTLYAQLESFYD